MGGFETKIRILPSDKEILTRQAEASLLYDDSIADLLMLPPGTMARVVETVLDFALAQRLPTNGPVNWSENGGQRSKYVLSKQFDVTLTEVELGNLVHHSLMHHLGRSAKVTPYDESRVRWWRPMRLPDSEVRAIHARAFSEGRSVASVLEEEMLRDIRQVRTDLNGGTDLTVLYCPWTDESDREYEEAKAVAKRAKLNVDTLMLGVRKQRRRLDSGAARPATSQEPT